MSILYWVCYPSALAKPTAAQVRAGQNATGAAATAAGNQTATLSGTGTFTWTVGATGLTASTSYKFAAVTDLGNDASVVESAAWSTLAAGLPVNGTSTGSLDLSGTATGTISQGLPVNGTSTGSLDLSGDASGTISLGLPVNGTSTGSLDLSGTATGTVVGDQPVNGTSTGSLDLSGTATGTISNPAGLPVNGTSTGSLDLSGTAAGTVVAAMSGTSTGSLDLLGTATGTISQGLPVNGTSTGSFDLLGTATGTIATSQLPVNGSSTGSFDLLGTASGIIVGDNLCPGLPPGWRMVRVLESVPNPNFGTPYGTTYFTRWTYITYDELGNFVCASGADTDCCSQAHAMAQQRTQQQPYDQAI